MNLQMLPELRGNIVWKPAALLTLASLPGLILAFSPYAPFRRPPERDSRRHDPRVFPAQPRSHPPLGTLSCLVAGFLSGWLNGAIGAGGPRRWLMHLSNLVQRRNQSHPSCFFPRRRCRNRHRPHLVGPLYASHPGHLRSFDTRLILGVWWAPVVHGMNAATYRKAVCIVLLLMGLLSLENPC
jgi:uncharacterized membrane protein YfcA